MTKKQRENIIYLIAGQCHPEFVKAGGGCEYEKYQQVLSSALEEAHVRWCKVKELNSFDYKDYDVVFLDSFLEESILLKLYGATNLMVLPYLNTQQISSGILADTVGSGRAALVTKFRYALELIHSNRHCKEGVVFGRHARGVLIDPGEKSIEQIAHALDFLVFNQDRRIKMEKQAHQRGYQMRWQNTAWSLIQHIEFVHEEREINTGRGVKFKREKTSKYQNGL